MCLLTQQTTMGNDSHCSEGCFDISIGNTFFKHKDIHKSAWLSPYHPTKNEIDYISISSRCCSSLQDVRVYRGADCGSDHFLLIAKRRLKFKRLKHAGKQITFDTSKLKDTYTRLGYQLEVRNRFASLKKLVILK